MATTRAKQSARSNQKWRTRKDLLRAAATLMNEGRKPSLDEIAEAAHISRATAYRYFPNVEALLLEAALDLAAPEANVLFTDENETDPVARVTRVDAAFHDMMEANEIPLRMMLAASMERSVAKTNGNDAEDELPARQNRRSPLIEEALAPARSAFKPADLDKLQKTLALIIGTESMVVFKDVLQLGDKEAREVTRWAIRTLIEGARKG